MNTLEFFQTILPPEGVYFLALIHKETKRVGHKPYKSLEELANAVEQLDKNEIFNLYHACASYKSEYVVVDGAKKTRNPANWDRAKALWIDLDCGEDKAAKGDGYLTKKLAKDAVDSFCKLNEFPLPMVVDSGNGVHCYWPFTKAIKPEAWLPMANAFKVVLAHHKVLADPTVTADLSRILRPAGATNRKRDAKPVAVKRTVDPMDPKDLWGRLKWLVSDAQLTPEAVRVVAGDINDDLTAHATVEIPSSAEITAQRCNQVAQMRDTQGDVSYDHWRGVIGIIKFSTEGIELAHKWSERRAETGHSNIDTDIRYNTWGSAPTTCEFFSRCNPEGCVGCEAKKDNEKLKTPLVLGRFSKPDVETTAVVEMEGEDEETEVTIPAKPVGYKFSDGVMVRELMDKNDIMIAHPFSQSHFYPTRRIRKENGEFSLGFRLHLPRNKIRDFEIDTNLINSPMKLMDALGKYEITTTNNKEAMNHLSAYVRESLEKLKQETEEVNTLTAFGWRDDYKDFLIGNRLYHRDGTVREVFVGGKAAPYVTIFPKPRGCMEDYAEALNYLYADKGQEHYQYAIAHNFGSVLTPFSDSLYKGCILNLYGKETSRGKTTVFHAALYGFGNAQKMMVNGHEGATVNALHNMMGAFQNLPLLVDEATHMEQKDFSKLSYSVSNGEERKRMTSSAAKGLTMAESGSWALGMGMTANKDMHSLLGSENGDTTAEAVRLIQIHVDSRPFRQFETGDVVTHMKEIEANLGAAGDVYIKWLVTHPKEFREILAKWESKFASTITEPKYRKYRNHGACSLAATEITNMLGITKFDIEALYEFAVDLFKDLGEIIAENNTVSDEDALGMMINDLQSRFITTSEYRKSNHPQGLQLPLKPVNGVPAGRYITGTAGAKHPEEHAGRVYVVRKEAHDWCEKKRLNLKDIIAYASANKILIPMATKFTVGRGSTVTTGNSTCICINFHKYQQLTGQIDNPNWPVSEVIDGGRKDEEPLSLAS